MRTLVLSTVALGVLTTAATAEPATPTATTGPVALTDEQMDRVTAGQAEVSPGPPPTGDGQVKVPDAAPLDVVEPGEPTGERPAELSGEPRQRFIILTPGAAGDVDIFT